ncbi:MAG: TonB-dependent receptor, partial [Bacteroidota bacterium]
MLQKTGISLVFLFLIPFVLRSQPYEVNCKERPLNKLLVELRDRYDLHFSFDDELLSRYSITIDETFTSSESLVEALLAGLPLNYEMTGEVFVIFRAEILPRKKDQQKEYLVRGQVLERSSGEQLPYSHVLVDDHPLVTDQKGVFSFTAFNDSVFKVKASHLGCFVLDTTLTAGRFHKLYLTPSVYYLPEIVVKDNRVERSVQMGEGPGLIKLNSYITGYLPGNGDNAVFNLLRLQPGIVAAGEQPNDLIIWGGYEGTSRVSFDGFTIWGLKNFNDNISAVNPFLAKDMEIYKGGYDASKEDVVGGLVSIAGKNGNRSNTGLHLFGNNQTLNGMLEVPLSRKSSLILATRHTYYNLFDEDDMPLSSVNASENLRYR